VAALHLAAFVVYWCYGTQLSRQWRGHRRLLGPQKRPHQLRYAVHRMGCGGQKRRHQLRYAVSPHGAWRAFIGLPIAGVLFDRYHHYRAAFYTAAVLAAVALVCEMLARRPAAPEAAR
jgi:hypothetical protein